MPLAGKMNAWPGGGLEDLLEVLEDRGGERRESPTSGDPPWRDAWRGGYDRARWWARERRGSCGRPCAEPSVEGNEGGRERGRPHRKSATLEASSLHIHAANPMYSTLHLFSQGRSVEPCPADSDRARRGPPRSWRSSTPSPPPRLIRARRSPRRLRARCELRRGASPGSSPSARRPCRWPGRRSAVLARARPRAGGRPGRVSGSRRRRRIPAARRRRRRPSRARPRLPRRRRGSRPSGGARVGPDDEVWVLLSGGTTSLLGAPVDGISPERPHRALLPAARLRPRHHRDEPDPEALLPLGRRPPRPGARAGPGPRSTSSPT